MASALFSPIKIGPFEVKNRIMMPGMSAGMILDNGEATPEMIAYYVERARNEPGLMAVGASAVVPPRGPSKHPLAIYDDRFIPSLKTLVDAVHQYDTKFGVQLWDGGMQTGGKVQLTPSSVGINAKAVFSAAEAPVPKVLTTSEVEEVVQYFADAAKRCAEAGFDFVEIHAGHGYLISNFMTPYFNRRTDAYGGGFDNRIRFLVEILRQTRRSVGDGVGVGVKINGDDFLDEGGWAVADACRLAPILQSEGADYISVTGGVMGAKRLTVPPLYEKQGCFVDMAAEVKAHVTIPVATVGRVKRPEMAEALVQSGQVDIVCMGRAMIADPDVVGKARRGDLADIRLCLAECRGCIDQEMRGIKSGSPGVASCVVNPRMGRESVCIDVEGDKRDSPRRILVVGAGIAGLEAARRSAFSGHEVILCESRSAVGGQIRCASQVPGRAEIGDMIPWYERQIAKHRIDLRLDTTVDGSLLDAIRPDVVVVATGSTPSVPQDMLQTLYDAEAIDIVMADDVFDPNGVPGRNVLVIGGDQIGMQIADYLSEGGREVVVAETKAHFAQKMAANDRWYLISRTSAKQVRRIKNVQSFRIDGAAGVCLVTDRGEEQLSGIDTIVLANERRSTRTVAELARDRNIEVHLVGDASDIVSDDSGTIFTNIAQAYDLARNL